MANCEPWYVRVGRPPVFAAFRLGAWRLLGGYTGDSATMGLLDQAFWAYKRENPLTGRRGARRLLADALSVGRHPVGGSAEHATATMVFLGDIMPLRPFCETMPKVELAPEVTSALGADALFANLEGPVGDAAAAGDGGGLLGGAPRLAMTDAELAVHLEYLRASEGSLVMATANNHAWDLGVEGVRRTVETLRRRGVTAAGTWTTADHAADFVVAAVGRHRVGVVPFTFGTNGLHGPAQDRAMVNVAGLNERDVGAAGDRLEAAIREARSAGSGLVVVSLHWGLEFEWYPTERQIGLARRLVDAGADIVWGHHPHVIQPVEVRKRRANHGAGVIVYSAGNLITPVLTPHTRLSVAVRVGVVCAGDHLRVHDVEVIPLVLSPGQRCDHYRLDTLAGMTDRADAAVITDHLRVPIPSPRPS